MDRRMNQLFDSTERVLRHPSVGQMPTGLTPGSSIAATGDKRFHLNRSQGSAGERECRNQRVSSSTRSTSKAKDWNTREVQILLVDAVANELLRRTTARTRGASNPLSTRSFDLFEAIVFFRNVDYDYRSRWGDRVRRQPYQPGFPYPFFPVFPTIIRLFLSDPYVLLRALTASQ